MPAAVIGQHGAVNDNMAAGRAFEAGNEADDRRFTRAGCPEQRRDAFRAFEGGFECESGSGEGAIKGDHSRPAPRRTVRRASHSETTRATMAIIAAMSDMRSAFGSPPGV